MIPATISIEIDPPHAALLMRVIERFFETGCRLRPEDRVYLAEKSASLAQMALFYREHERRLAAAAGQS